MVLTSIAVTCTGQNMWSGRIEKGSRGELKKVFGANWKDGRGELDRWSGRIEKVVGANWKGVRGELRGELDQWSGRSEGQIGERIWHRTRTNIKTN